MSEARALTNLVGYDVGTIAVAKMTGQLDGDRMRDVLDKKGEALTAEAACRGPSDESSPCGGPPAISPLPGPFFCTSMQPLAATRPDSPTPRCPSVFHSKHSLTGPVLRPVGLHSLHSQLHHSFRATPKATTRPTRQMPARRVHGRGRRGRFRRGGFSKEHDARSRHAKTASSMGLAQALRAACR